MVHGQDADTARPIAVLTFDDAVKSHRTFVAPLLKEYGFNASFFVTYAWMSDTTHFMNWQDIADLAEMGFEVGNHTWTHANFSQPAQAFELEGELVMMEWMLGKVGIEKPVSFAHTGNAFGPEAVEALSNLGYQFARRGKQPEVAYGSLAGGPGYDPHRHHPLLIPTTIDFYPGMNMDTFTQVMERVPANEIAVLQFHGVPDVKHPWVDTPPGDFRQYMDYLRDHDYQVIALGDLGPFLPEQRPDDPMLSQRYPSPETDLSWPREVHQSRSALAFWTANMYRHGFTGEEMSRVLGLDLETVDSLIGRVEALPSEGEKIEVWPYPGGRHPRIDFQEGMLSPRRGTKLSLFLPWDEEDYVVLDVPEAVMSQFGITFLGHKHIPTVFDLQQIQIHNSDWQWDSTGMWHNLWALPNGIEIGASVRPAEKEAQMRLWLTNLTEDTLFQKLQTQVCVMLGQTKHFAAQTNDNKLLQCPVSAVQSEEGHHWIITGWQGCSRPWGNDDCPCLHADPRLPDCPPGQTVAIEGLLQFYAGDDVEGEMARMKRRLNQGPD